MSELARISPRPFAAEFSESASMAELPLSTARLVSQLCISLVVTTVLCSRLALPFGAKQVPLALPVALLHLVVITFLVRATVSVPRLLATAGVLALLCFETALVHQHFSLMSLLYIIAMYVPLVVNTNVDEAGLHRIWRAFIGLGAFAAILGLAQIALQVAGGGYYLDPAQQLPASIQQQGYSITYPIMRGVVPTLKANGMLFVEPSAFSQFLALAMLGELWLYRRAKVLWLLAAGLTVSFSGTGILMLVGGLAFGAKPRALLGMAGGGIVIMGILIATGYGAAFTSRIGEVSRPGSSGYERFVAPFAALGVPWNDSLSAVFWGYGAGQVEDLDTEYSANYSPVPKVTLEYGLVGLAAFTALWVTMFGRLAVQRPIAGAMVVMYFLAAGSLLQPYTVFALWGLTAGFLKGPLAPEDVDAGAGEEPEPVWAA